jgi:hypothetical protein
MRGRVLAFVVVLGLLVQTYPHLTHAAAALTCKPLGTALIRVDNSQATYATTGVVLNQSGWPCVQIALKNDHTFWMKVDVFASSAGVLTTADDKWSQLGYIPSKSQATFTVIFDGKFDSYIIFFLNAGKTEDGSPSAALYTVLERTVDAMLLALGATKRFVDVDLKSLIDITEYAAGLTDCVSAIGDVLDKDVLAMFGVLDKLRKCLTDEDQAKIITEILAEYGEKVTLKQVKDLLPLLDLPKLIEEIVDTLVAIATESTAGSIQFTSSPIKEPDRTSNTA